MFDQLQKSALKATNLPSSSVYLGSAFSYTKLEPMIKRTKVLRLVAQKIALLSVTRLSEDYAYPNSKFALNFSRYSWTMVLTIAPAHPFLHASCLFSTQS